MIYLHLMHRVRHIVVAVHEHTVSEANANNTATKNAMIKKNKAPFMVECSLLMIA